MITQIIPTSQVNGQRQLDDVVAACRLVPSIGIMSVSMGFVADEHVSSSSPHRRLTVVCHVQLRTTQLDNRCSEWRPSV